MTLGERIKYFREQAGLRQSDLAARAELHPVSIRKYETNRMQPQLPQIEKIAAALNISSNTLLGIEHSNLKLETVGDFMSILCMLLNTRKLKIEGDRKEDGFIKPETLRIIVDNAIILKQIVNWDKMDYLYNQVLSSKVDTPDEAYRAILAQIQETKEKVTLETQRSNVLLDESDGITVKINPET